MEMIPLQAIPNQQTKVVLNNQNCQIAVYVKGNFIYMDLNSNGIDTYIGALCRNAVLINPCLYAAFIGNFVFIDTQGNSDPTYDGLGIRYQLVYFDEDDLAAIAEGS